MAKKKVNKKSLLFLTIIILVVMSIITVVVVQNKKTNENGKFTILEKKWIEKNQSKIVDVSVINDLPIFGEDGDGVFFDFLKSFTKENKIRFNLIPYSSKKSASTNEYFFEINNKTKLGENELLFYKDNYVLISKDNKSVRSIDDLENFTVGILDSDLNSIKEYFNDNNKIIFNSYNDIDSIISAVNNNEVLYAAIPKNYYIDKILKNNYYIVYNIPELSSNYTFNVKGNNKTLNNILKKYYIRWSKNKLAKDYNERLFELYFAQKKIDDVTKADFLSKEYTYGYIKNLPYESKINDKFIGFNSEILDAFASQMGISFKVKEYKNVNSLTNALNNGDIDLAFNYYDLDELTNGFDYTFSPYKEKVVVLTSIKNTETSVSSLHSLRGLDVMVVNDKIYKRINEKLNLKATTYDSASDLFKKLNDDSIVLVDYNVYNYYRNDTFKNYKVVYEQDIDTEFNFITLNSNRNKAFNGLFKFYISTLDSGLYTARAYSKLQKDRKIIDLKYIYTGIALLVLGVIHSVIKRKTTNTKLVKKNEKAKYVDHLTSLKNRNYLNQNYPKWQNNKIYPQAIIIIELNKIGHINDVYGHEEGDLVIKKAANILINNQLEQSDIVRTNGDEFLIYMVGYEETKVVTYMRKLFKEFKSLPYNFGVSLGYSMILDDIKTIDDAMNEAVLEIKTSKEMNNE